MRADFVGVPATIPLGFPARIQEFVNDTGADVCRVDLVESPASTFELFEANPPIAPGGTLTIDVADVNHAVRTLGCGGSEVQAAVVWEFNQVESARQVVDSVDGTVGAGIEQQGELFRIGSYQVYLAGLNTVTDDAASFTVGREQAEVAFLNDTGVELCEVGFSPTLTNYYTTYLLFDDEGNPDTFAVDSIFTIEAPVAEVDIRTLDCDGNIVTEVLEVQPTAQVDAVSTGQPV